MIEKESPPGYKNSELLSSHRRKAPPLLLPLLKTLLLSTTALFLLLSPFDSLEGSSSSSSVSAVAKPTAEQLSLPVSVQGSSSQQPILPSSDIIESADEEALFSGEDGSSELAPTLSLLEGESAESVTAVVHFKIPEGWHLYGPHPDNISPPPIVQWTLPDGWEAGALRWPETTTFEVQGERSFGYEGELTFLATFKKTTPTTPQREDSPPSETPAMAVQATVDWVACSELFCMPGAANLSATYQPIAAAAAKPSNSKAPHEEISANLPSLKRPPEATTSLLADSREIFLPAIQAAEGPSSGQLLALLGAALLGGALLNLMPCVLPILSLKLLSLIALGKSNRSTAILHAITFTGGVLVSFWLLAGMLMALQSSGEAVGWGFQLQNPLCVALLAFLFLSLALNLFGIFEWGSGVVSLATQCGDKVAVQKKDSLRNAFFNGTLATLVATPCTGPFLGSAVGAAVLLPPLFSWMIFTAVGIGMASPYLVVSCIPSVGRWLPRPGPWMTSFKALLGFLMLVATLWLIWVFAAIASEANVIPLLFGMILIAFAAWCHGTYGSSFTATRLQKSTARLTTALSVLVAFWIAYGASNSPQETSAAAYAATTLSQRIDRQQDSWEPFSEKRLQELREAGTPVFVNFTARWCLICQVNHQVLQSSSVASAFATTGVHRMVADWTQKNSAITRELARFGRNSVPLYVLYPPIQKGDKQENRKTTNEPILLPQLLTAEEVISQLHRISQKDDL